MFASPRTLLLSLSVISGLGVLPQTTRASEAYVGGALDAGGARDDFRSEPAGLQKAEYEIGLGAALFVGKSVTPQVRGELELSYHQNGLSNIDTTLNEEDSGHTNAVMLMSNLYYDLPVSWRVTPYVGAGIGFAHVRQDLVKSVADDTVHDEDWVFAHQFIVGASLPVGDRWTGFADYRYTATSDQDLINSGGVPVESKYVSERLTFGLRRTF